MNKLTAFFRSHPGGGVHPPHRKHTAECATVDMPVPVQVTLLMSQHIGAPCEPTVQVGDTVAVGQVIGDSAAPVSVPIHSSVSGTVSAITTVMLPAGNQVKALVIDTDGEQRIADTVQPPQVTDREQFIAAVRASGLVGLGGAGFPVHIKLSPPNPEAIDTLIINAAECEPYITADYRECMEYSEDIIEGCLLCMKYLDIHEAVIGIEDNKPLAIQRMRQLTAQASTPEYRLRVRKLPAKYPRGAEKVLITACSGRRVPPGKLPADVGCILLNVSSVGFIARYIKTGMPLISKRLTVDGSAVACPQNVRVPLGTKIGDVLDFCGGATRPIQKLLMGGPMMGLSLMDDTLPILKQNNAILAMGEDEAPRLSPSDCIRCGRCVAHCPMNLNPTALFAAYQARDAEQLKKLGIMSCMECGCCSYGCPAHRPLIQNMKMAKQELRRQSQK